MQGDAEYARRDSNPQPADPKSAGEKRNPLENLRLADADSARCASDSNAADFPALRAALDALPEADREPVAEAVAGLLADGPDALLALARLPKAKRDALLALIDGEGRA